MCENVCFFSLHSLVMSSLLVESQGGFSNDATYSFERDDPDHKLVNGSNCIKIRLIESPDHYKYLLCCHGPKTTIPKQNNNNNTNKTLKNNKIYTSSS